MVTSKIILLLRKFDKKDITGFKEFLRSPYFNKKEKLLDFYNVLIKYYPDFDENKYKKEIIYKNLYPGSRFNLQVYKNLSSELYNAARIFCAIENFKSNKLTQNINLLTKLEQIGAEDLYRIEIQNLRKKISEIKIDNFIFYHKYEIAALEKMFFFNRGNFKKGLEFSMEESNELLKFYLMNMFRQRFDFEVSRLNFNMSFDENAFNYFVNSLMKKGMLEETINYFETNDAAKHENIVMLYYIMMSLIEPFKDIYFDKAKGLMLKNINKFDKTVQYIISSSLLTVCTFKINRRGKMYDYRNAFDLFNFQLRRKIYKEDPESYITATEFRDVFMIGLHLKEFDWLKRFMQKYIVEVSPESRENIMYLLKGILKFYEKKFEESLDLLNLVKFEQFIYKLDIRKMQLFIYYELNLFEQALSLISSFREFLNSNKNVSEITRKNNLKVIYFTSKLIKLKNEYNEYELLHLEKEISETSFVLYKGWFEEKIKMLKKKY